MSKRLIMICAMAIVLGLAVSAHAAVQNVKVSGDLKVSAIGRDAFDLGTDNDAQESGVIMSQTRVRIDTDLTENVAATVRLLNETDWGREGQVADTTDTVDDLRIDLANLTLKEFLYSPLTVTLGRQEIMLGAGFVIGDADTDRTAMINSTAGTAPIANLDLSMRKSFDAIRATLDYNPLIIDAFYSKVDENTKTSGAADAEDKDDIDLYGVNARYSLGDKWGTMLEGYLLYENDQTTNGSFATMATDTSTIWCPGLRVVAAPMKDLVLTTEVAWQKGTYLVTPLANGNTESRNRDAFAAQATASFALPFEKIKKYSPVIGGSYSFYSGDKNPADGTTDSGAGDYKGWDPMYENQGSGKIYNVLFDATNCSATNLNASMVPMEDVTLRLDYTDLWLATEINVGRWGTGTDAMTLYGINGQSNTAVQMSEKHLGQEIDISAVYDYTEDVKFGLSYGAFLPGNAFAETERDREAATQLIGTCAISF